MRSFLVCLLALVACSDVTVVDDDGNGGSGGVPGLGGAPGFGGQDPCLNGTCAGGFGVGGDGGAPPEAAIYSAESLATGVPRFVVNKAVPARDVCVTLVVEAFGSPGMYELTANEGWAVNNIVVSQDASQCDGANWPGSPDDVIATAATGTLVADAANVVCMVSVHAVIQFPPDAPWVELEETFDVDDLDVVGGCN